MSSQFEKENKEKSNNYIDNYLDEEAMKSSRKSTVVGEYVELWDFMLTQGIFLQSCEQCSMCLMLDNNIENDEDEY